MILYGKKFRKLNLEKQQEQVTNNGDGILEWWQNREHNTNHSGSKVSKAS